MSHEDVPNYDEDAVLPMREELTRVGFKEMRTREAVDEAFQQPGTSVVIINSVCGCAAGGARPGVSMALQNDVIPDRAVTSFAGQDKRAVARIREHLSMFAPSSPFIAVLKDGKPVKVMQRHDIEGKDAGRVAAELKAAFDANCARKGPSISPEDFAKYMPVEACGSKIPPHTVKIQGMPDRGPAAPVGEESDSDKKGWWKLFNK